MAISVTIRPQDASTGGTDVSIPTGEGAIDTREEAQAVLAAIPAGQDASNKVFIAGGQSLSYAEITGLACLGRIPRHTVFASQDNWVLSHAGQCPGGTTISGNSGVPPVTEARAGEAMTLPDAAAVRAIGGLRPDAEILGVQFDSLPEMTTAPYAIPASAMTAGPHQLKIRYRNPGETQIRFQTVTINAAAEGGIGGASGAVLNMPATTSRPPLVAGQPAAAIPVGSVQTTAGFPVNSTYQLYVDGNPVGTAQPLPADRNTPLTLPSSVADGAHQVQLRVLRPNQATILYPTINVTVGPATPPVASLTAARITSTASYYANDLVSLTVTSNQAGLARITVGNYTQDVTLTAGVNNISMTGAPKTWNTGATGRSNQTVKIQPLAGTTLAGTEVTVGTVSIQRQGHGGGTARPPVRRPPPPL